MTEIEDRTDIELLAKVLAGDEAALNRYAISSSPLEVLSVVLGQVHDRYLKAVDAGQAPASVGPEVQKYLPAAEMARRRAGPAQREIDLHTLRVLRHGGHLCAVLGAGATMNAGGPSWPQLVRRLLTIGLGDGYRIAVTKPRELLRITDLVAGTAERVIGFRPFTPGQRGEAISIVSAIDAGTATTETLKQGAELCLAVAGQRLFADVTDILYENDREPGAIHAAVAELAEPMRLFGSGDRRAYGWSALITYNFDDFMGEALDRRNVPRAAWTMRGGELVGDANSLAKKQGQDGPYLPILHLHGYSPRRFFYITNIRYVFATSQYDTIYAADQRPLLDSVFTQLLANPAQRAVYIGCSFEDDRMNELLEQSRRHLPGCEHWAFLRWPGPGRYSESTADQIERHARRYVAFGVRPIWFDEYAELPGLIQRLK
jgi:hypothetical protein